MATLTNLKKGGNFRYVIKDVIDGTMMKLPAGSKIDAVISEKVGTTAGNLELGTTAGGEEIVAAVALGTVDGVFDTETLVDAGPYSLTAETPIYFTISGGQANIYLLMQQAD